MTIPEYPDWSQPVAQIEQVTTLFSSSTIPLVGGSTGNLDTSKQQTLIGSFLPTGIPETSMLALSFEWDNGPGAILTDTITCWDNADDTVGGGCTFRIPVRGTMCNIFWESTNGTARTGSLTVIGSTRAEPTPFVTEQVGAQGRVVLATGNVNVPANGVSTFKCGPVARAVSLLYQGPTGTSQVQVNAVNNNGAALSLVNLARETTNGGPQFVPELLIPMSALSVSLVNTTAAAAIMFAYLWDVS